MREHWAVIPSQFPEQSGDCDVVRISTTGEVVEIWPGSPTGQDMANFMAGDLAGHDGIGFIGLYDDEKKS